MYPWNWVSLYPRKLIPVNINETTVPYFTFNLYRVFCLVHFWVKVVVLSLPYIYCTGKNKTIYLLNGKIQGHVILYNCIFTMENVTSSTCKFTHRTHFSWRLEGSPSSIIIFSSSGIRTCGLVTKAVYNIKEQEINTKTQSKTSMHTQMMEELWQTTFIALSSKYWKEKNLFLKKTR